MQAQPLYGYYYFGACERFLLDASVHVALSTKESGGYRDNIKRFLGDLERLNLQVSARAAGELRAFAQDLAGRPDASTLSEEEAKMLGAIMWRLRPTLTAELAGFEVFILTPKRLDAQKLLHDAPSLLPAGVFGKLPSTAQFDLQEAARCIAFDRPTAAVFHLMRATEGVLRVFYEALVKRGRKHTLWGPIVLDLRGRRAAKPYEALLNHLDNIRTSFRNPTQHPDARHDIDEAQNLWSLSVDAISRMAKAL